MSNQKFEWPTASSKLVEDTVLLTFLQTGQTCYSPYMVNQKLWVTNKFIKARWRTDLLAFLTVRIAWLAIYVEPETLNSQFPGYCIPFHRCLVEMCSSKFRVFYIHSGKSTAYHLYQVTLFFCWWWRKVFKLVVIQVGKHRCSTRVLRIKRLKFSRKIQLVQYSLNGSMSS